MKESDIICSAVSDCFSWNETERIGEVLEQAFGIVDIVGYDDAILLKLSIKQKKPDALITLINYYNAVHKIPDPYKASDDTPQEQKAARYKLEQVLLDISHGINMSDEVRNVLERYIPEEEDDDSTISQVESEAESEGVLSRSESSELGGEEQIQTPSQTSGYSDSKEDNIMDMGYTALHLAVMNDDVEKVKFLLGNMSEEEILKGAEGNDDFTALHYAVGKGNNQLIEILLTKTPALANQEDVFQQLPLHWAVAKSNLTAVKLVLKCTALEKIVEQSKYYGQTVMILAMIHKDEEVVNMLLEKLKEQIGLAKKLILTSNDFGKNPLQLAIDNGMTQTEQKFKEFLQACSDADDNVTTAIPCEIVNLGDVNLNEYVIDDLG
jgi:hypothetical protein